jgi:hypothetical protein
MTAVPRFDAHVDVWADDRAAGPMAARLVPANQADYEQDVAALKARLGAAALAEAELALPGRTSRVP